MLTIDTINESIATASVLDARDICLVPEQGSPLERLVQLSSINKESISGNEYIPDAEVIAAKSIDSLDEHNTELEKMASDIAAFVQNHLNFAKNNVKPIIEAAVEKVKANLDAVNNTEPSLTIIKTEVPEPLLVAAFQDSVNEYKDVNYIPYSEMIPTDVNYTATEIIELIKTGNVDLDSAITLMHTRVGDAFVEEVFNSIFKFTNKSPQQMQDDKDTGVDASVLNYLIANKLYDAPFEGIKLDLPKFNDVIDLLRKQAAYSIINFNVRVNREYKSKQLVTKYTSTSITVNSAVYKEWIETGGSDTVLFGNACSANPKMYVEDIEEIKQELLDRWSQECNMIIMRNNSRSYTMKKEIIYSAIVSTVDENLELCFGHLVAEGVELSTVIPEYKQYQLNLQNGINLLKESDMVNLWATVTDLVCDSVFYYTASKDILRGVEEAMRVNKELTIREALLLSTIEYVVDYVANQVVKK